MEYTARIEYEYTDADALPEGAAANTLYIYTDVYTVDRNRHDDASARAWIRRDLRLVAGGGYDEIDDENIRRLNIRRDK